MLQQGHSDCGVACLSSIVHYHGGEITLEKLRELSGTSIQGTTLLGIYQAAQQLGFEAEALQSESINNLIELDDPAILHVLIDNRLQHYFVFYGFENDKAVIGDPAKGIILYSKEELNQLWQSKALLKLTLTSNFIK